ncbi:alkaline phosphatase family protein [Tomitella gaofuii]|uniref:alkaline phosphatase family protein n=1 Tax=Tomitella gaofuii TaxID=2760083 RepID=UPI0015F8A990|nr:alkaline phosphatase family protein [Tomitella gaofuii]
MATVTSSSRQHDPAVPAPACGSGTIADLVPSALAVLGLPGEADRLDLHALLGPAPVRRLCILLVDGLGARQLAACADAAPLLTSRGAPATAESMRVIGTGFPSTTAVSLSSLGTGVPPGEHGLVGYLMAVPGFDRAMNPLRWRLHGEGDHVDLLAELPPEQFQPRPTAFERAAGAGVAVTRVAPGYQAKSGLTRASLRGGRFDAAFSLGDLAARSVAALAASDRALVYTYHGDLDLTGHVRGPDSDSWRDELAQVDLLTATIVRDLPEDAALIVTADHGMLGIDDPLDLDDRDGVATTAGLLDGVRLIGGEPRDRHVYTREGAAADVRDRWEETLAARADGRPAQQFAVVERDDAIARGWFGPIVTDDARRRIGDVLAVATGTSALIRRSHEPLQSRLIGHHGALTPVEREIPLLGFR